MREQHDETKADEGQSILTAGLEQIDAAMLKCWAIHAHGPYNKEAFKELQRVIERTALSLRQSERSNF